jgi:MFS family permease
MRVIAAALLFVSLFVPFAYFNHSDGWNQGARLAELHAIVLQRTLAIDNYHLNTGDKALINGHYYSEKAPAIVVLALPVFTATAVAQRMAGIDPDTPEAWRVSNWTATAGSVGLLAALGGVAFFSLLRHRMSSFAALVATYALFLGSIGWPYATALFAHGATIGLLAIALWAVLSPESARRDYIAGLTAGFAVAAEYPAVIPCAAIALYLTYANPARTWRYGLALIPAAILILGNNYLIAGSPFSIGYGSNPAFPEINASNSFGFNLPDPEALSHLVWGEYRGLFFWSPALLMAVPGLAVLLREDRRTAWMITIVFAFTMLQVSSFFGWFGGNAVGPRYLAPALPFVGLAAAHGIKRFPTVGALLTAASVAIMTMVSAIAIDPPQDVLTPLQSFYLMRWRTDRFAENLGTVLGLSPFASLVTLAVVVIAGAAGVWLTSRERSKAPAA